MEVEENPSLGWSAFTLVAANLITIALAVAFDWKVGEVLWIYLIQSFVIGFFSLVRVLGLIRLNAQQPQPKNPEDYVQSLPGFVIYFGFFNTFFLMVLSVWQGFPIDAGVAICIVMFLVHSALDDRRDRSLDATEGTPDPMKIIYLALARILPFFLMLMLAVIVTWKHQIVYMLLVKTIADSAMHPAGCGSTRSLPDGPDFTILGTDVYLPFNRTVGLTIVVALLVGGYFASIDSVASRGFSR